MTIDDKEKIKKEEVKASTESNENQSKDESNQKELNGDCCGSCT